MHPRGQFCLLLHPSIRLCRISISFLFFLILSCNTTYSADVLLSSAPTQVFFSPNGGCTEAVVNAIDKAKESVYVQAYSFTSEPIAEALVRANKRCHKVAVVLDKSQLTAKNTMLSLVNDAGIETFIDKKHAIAHNKVMVIDGHTVITGSFKLTNAAELQNTENLLIVDSKELAKKYYDNFMTHKSHSVRCSN